MNFKQQQPDLIVLLQLNAEKLKELSGLKVVPYHREVVYILTKLIKNDRTVNDAYRINTRELYMKNLKVLQSGDLL